MAKIEKEIVASETEASSPATSETGELEYLNKNAKHRPFWKKTILYILTLKIEPGLLLYMIGSVMGNIIASDLQIERACIVNKGFNETICENLMKRPVPPGYKPYETEVQDVVSKISIWSEVIDNLFPILFAIFLGSWSDTYGQRLPFLLSIFGVILRYAGLFTATYYADWGAEAIIMLSVVPSSITGGRIAISMIVYSYISVTTTVKERTVRMGIITAVRLFGRSAGSTLSGYLKRGGVGNRTIFGIGIGLAALAFVYVLIFLSNPKHLPGVKNKVGAGKACDDLFNLQRIFEAVKSFVQKRPCGIRIQLYLLVLILIFTMAPMQGEDPVLYLYVRNLFDWRVEDYAFYGTIRLLIAFSGGIVSTLVLVKWLKMSDWIIGLIACCSQIAGSLVYAFAKQGGEAMMYIAPVVDILNGTMIIAARSMISKLIPRSEMGRVNAVVAVIDSTTPLWGNPLYSWVYNRTLSDFPGAFFVMSAALTIPPVGLFSYFGIRKQGIPYEEQIARKAAKTEESHSKPQ